MNQMIKMAVAGGLGVGMLFAAGCLTQDPYQGQTLATIHGALVEGPTATPPITHLKMAVSWMEGGQISVLPVATAELVPPPDAGVFPEWSDFSSVCGEPPSTGAVRITSNYVDLNGTLQSVSFAPIFPLEFTLPVTDLPPASSLVDLGFVGGEGKMAIGIVIAYDDTNGNGNLDRGTVTWPGEPVLATSYVWDPTYVVYLDGHLAPGKLPLELGFTLVRLNGGLSATVFGPEDLLRLEIGEGSQFFPPQALGCTEVQEQSFYGQSTVPANARIFCSESRRQYGWIAFEDVQGCRFQTYEGVVCLGDSDPLPAGWPCP